MEHLFTKNNFIAGSYSDDTMEHVGKGVKRRVNRIKWTKSKICE